MNDSRMLRLLGAVTVLLALAPLPAVAATGRVALTGHRTAALDRAQRVHPHAAASQAADEVLELTVVLRRDDQAGFDAWLRELYDPQSPHFRAWLTQAQIADRFGPSRDAYGQVVAWLEQGGLEIVERPSNRLTLTALATRTEAEKAFGVHIRDYRIEHTTFRANDADPELPPQIAARVAAVSGLADLARPRPQTKAIHDAFASAVDWIGKNTPAVPELTAASAASTGQANNSTQSPSGRWLANDGSGQRIGLLQFDTFDPNDVIDYFTLFGFLPNQIDKVSSVHVAGGATPGADQAEVLLDIAAIASVAPGADIVVYDGPFTGRHTSFQRIFNRMVDDGVSIISNSWAYCEDQTTLADVQSIDAIFQNAAMAGITVLNASGDSGSTCLDGSPNTAAVPASSPSATAVGGSSLVKGPLFIHEGESWWDGSGDVPPTGQGGFGVSTFFPRPGYQDALVGGSKRSIPDVVVNSDPASGVFICQASAGGCPTGQLYGGTSIAAPIWAAYVAILNQDHGSNLGALNPLLYPLAASDGFHDAASMGSDFEHVGLGSPNLNRLHLLLAGESVGAVDAAQSEAVHALRVESMLAPSALDPVQSFDIPADGDSEATILVQLRDAGGNTVAGKTVTLLADGGSAIIEPPSAVTSLSNGAAVFTITNLVAEDITLTATDTTDGVVVAMKPVVTFAIPPAASAGLSAFPTSVTADGLQTTTITVTLEDKLGRPTPGKLITLSQGDAHSVIQAPDPAVTDVDGQIEFVASNTVNEVVTYQAVDVTDGELPVPGTAVVTFSNAAPGACGSGALPTAEAGWSITPFATGFRSGPLSYGGINFGGCSGVQGPAFGDSGDYLFNFLNGDVFRLPAGGGAATSTNKLATIGPSLGWPVVGQDGRLYGLRAATTGDFTTGAVLELDPDTGAQIREVASNVKCANGLAVDPLSGDLFVDDQCFGGGSDDPNIYRIRNPGSVTPTKEIYATLPFTPNGNLTFAPDGTLYVVSGYTSPTAFVYRVSGTDQPGPVTVTAVPGVHSLFWTNVGEVDENGAAVSLITLSFDGQDLQLVDITTDPPTTTVIAHGIGGGFTGPDGCLYAWTGDGTTVYRLGDEDGGCAFAASGVHPSITLTPRSVDPDPEQGTSRTFTARVTGVEAVEGTPVFFDVQGANPRTKMVRADANGTAKLTYVGVKPGNDVILARATISDEILVSSRARVTWATGMHTSSLTLNPSVTNGLPGESATVTAALSDASTDPPVAVAGATIDFDLDGDTCSAVTNAEGFATCEVTPAVGGLVLLTANFDGTEELLPSSDSLSFNSIEDVELQTTTTTLPIGDCGDANVSGSITATDALIVLRTAVGSSVCGLCICDANDSGGVTASDALLVLRYAVGQPLVLNCPACGA